MTLALAAFISALAGSPHCVGMCGPFALACGQSPRGGILWHVGKITTYVVLGGLAGAFGSMLMAPAWIATSVSVLLVAWFSAVLAGIAPEPKWVPPGIKGVLARRVPDNKAPRAQESARSTFVFGLANGLLPCGLVYAALGLAVASSGFGSGALVMLAFGLGTVPALSALMLGGRRLAIRSLRARRLLALVVLVTGLASIAMRAGFMSGH
ncbi:MAG: sulfite exporter TauE/SafE family protein [Longimicrobiales bacterium]